MKKTLIPTLLLLVLTPPGAAQWTQWGGPTRDFEVHVAPPADWTAAPPALVWQRALGAGEASVLVDGQTLYTTYRDGGEEVIVALAAASGEPAWHYRYKAPLPDSLYVKHGDGPHATPVIAGDRLCALGIAGMLHCVDKSSGEPLWSHDLMSEYGGRPPDCGYGGSPLVVGKTLIVAVGGKGHGVMAFSIADGSVVWNSSADLGTGYAAPTRIEVGGQAQLVVFSSKRVVGLDPATGELLWQHPHETQYGVNASPPVFGDDGILFITSAYDNGSRGIALERAESGTVARELWYQRKLEVHFNNTVRIGDHVYGTSGDFGPVFFTAINVKTGELAWRKRDFAAKASILRLGDRLLLIDEKGKLVLASVSPETAEVEAEFQLVDGRVWAPPTLVGNRLYLRDREKLYAFRLGTPEHKGD